MAGGPRQSFVALVLVACTLGAVFKIVNLRAESPPVELRVQQVVRVRGGQAVIVLLEKDGARRLPVPVSNTEAAIIERGLLRPSGLAPDAVKALGGRILRASIDEVSGQRGFRAHLSVGTGAAEIALDAACGEALGLAVQAGAPIVADPAVLDEASIRPEDLRGRTARNLSSDRTPAPVLHI